MERNRKLWIIAVMLAFCITACTKGELTEGESRGNPEDGVEEIAEKVMEEETEETEVIAQEPEQSVANNVITAYLTEGIEYVDEVIPVQYGDDLSLLANLKYTNGSYVYQDGRVYYRRYHEDSYENAALWGHYDAICETKKEIVCIEENGTETVLFTDEGYGDIYLLDNRFYMTDGKPWEENGSTYTEERLYSVDMQGNDRIDYGRGSIYAVDTERKIFILEMWEDEKIYYIMNYETGEKKQLFPEPVDYFHITIRDYKDGWIYYETYDSDSAVSKLCAVSIEGEQKEIIAIKPSSDHAYYVESILDIEVDEDRVYFIFGGYDGSAVVFQGGILVSVKLDGTDYKAVRINDDAFYLCHDKDRALVYFPRNGLWSDNPSDGYDTLVWDVEADKCYRSDFPTNVLFCFDRRTGLMWRYCSADRGALCGITTFDWKTDVYAIPDDSGKIIRVAMDIEKYITKWEKEETKIIDYEDFYFADGVLYFKVEYNTYDKETSIGWRDGYRRLHTDIWRMKIGESKAEVLYSY